MVITATFLQKLALPGSNGTLPISVLLVPIIVLGGLVSQVLHVTRSAYLLLFALLMIGLCNFTASTGLHQSLPSLALFGVAQCSLIFRFSANVSIALPLHKFFRTAIFALALLGIVQFCMQFLVGPRFAFYFDYMPDGIIVRNFNVLNPLAWNSPVLKSNGVFLLEPAVFSQLVCIAIVLEVLTWRDPLRLLTLIFAELVSFSGTGLMMLAFFLPVYAFIKGQYRVLVWAFAVAVIVYIAAEPLGLTSFTSRINEFGSRESSGWARFISPFLYLRNAAFEGPWAFLLGHGPGSIEETKSLGYAVFDPTWAKLLYEYGALGFGAYVALLYSTIFRSTMPLRFSLCFSYLLLGGYLLIPWMVALLAVMVAWTSDECFAKSTADFSR